MRNILITALFLPALAYGQEDDGALRQARRIIAKKDRNGDGKLDAKELGVEAFVFDALDRNGDGFVDATELKSNRRGAAPAKRDRGPASLIQRLDKDGDGKISKAEFPEQSRLKFGRLDRNGDGFITKDEIPQGNQRGRRKKNEKQLREMATRLMKRHDKDGDGKLTAGELVTPGADGQKGRARFNLKKSDKNGDGAIDLNELTMVLAQAQKRGQRGRNPRMLRQALQRMDADKDGRITRKEWRGRKETFARLDADKDGAVTKQEIEKFVATMKRWRGAGGEAIFRRWDGNKDGKITLDEWRGRKEFFARFDRNKDGVITPDEVTVMRGRRGKGHGPDVRSGKGSAHFLQKYDKDRDGRVSKKEFPHERRFAEIDANGDGVLSKPEIEEALDKRMRESKLGFFERFDLNGDGKVTRAEFTGPAADFEKRDRNNDGVIDRSDRPDAK